MAMGMDRNVRVSSAVVDYATRPHPRSRRELATGVRVRSSFATNEQGIAYQTHLDDSILDHVCSQIRNVFFLKTRRRVQQ